MEKKLPKIIFIEVKKSLEKIIKIIQIAKWYFEKSYSNPSLKKNLIFLVSDEKSKKFVDDLLWKEPKISFIPHSIDIFDFITITKKELEANYIFNLTENPISILPKEIIYEFDDQTEPKKIKISKKKFKFYKEKSLSIESR
ncbi:MAG: hypothetical protein AMS24_01420 [Chlamydiae bacterium SM23_39]|nr:MAG: hypothetical protein AMS24_01420 [Chlamydiae bacterium SM23_39]